MKENIIDLVDVSVVDGQIVITPKDGVYVQLVDKAIDDDWVDGWEQLRWIKGYVVDGNAVIDSYINHGLPTNNSMKNTFKAESQAIAAIAIAQLTQLMAQPCVNGDWKPDWYDAAQEKWSIVCYKNNMVIECYVATAHPLSFRDELTAEKFLQKYRSYIEQAAPILFGVEL